MASLSVRSSRLVPLPLHATRLLVVEDDPGSLVVITSYLEIFGYAYDVASTGEDAVRVARRLTYGLILMDVNLPGVSGIEATKRIRAHEVFDHRFPVPIVGLTAETPMDSEHDCLTAGMTDFITKPFGFVFLQQKLDNL